MGKRKNKMINKQQYEKLLPEDKLRKLNDFLKEKDKPTDEVKKFTAEIDELFPGLIK